MPEWGRVGFLPCAEGENTVGVWAENAEEGERTWTASSGIVAALQAGAELRASFLAIGEPFGGGFCATGGLGGEEVSLGGQCKAAAGRAGRVLDSGLCLPDRLSIPS